MALVPAARCVLVLGLVAGLIMLQPNLGTTIIIASIVLTMLFVAGVPLLPLARPRRWRCAASPRCSWPHAVPPRAGSPRSSTRGPTRSNTGLPDVQSLVGIANGGLARASGSGESTAKWGFLPDAHTDFIFAIIGEELGLVGALVVVAAVRRPRRARRLRSPLGARTASAMLVAAGITAWILRPGVRQHRRA